MAQITLTIPDPYILRLTTAINALYSIPRIINPEWAKIKIKDFLVNTLKRYEEREAGKIAKDSVDIPDDLVS